MSIYNVINIILDKDTGNYEGLLCINSENPNNILFIKECLLYKTPYKDIDYLINHASLFGKVDFIIETFHMESFQMKKKDKN